MGEHTGISWTNHTFNPWWGCVKVSEACRNCYAEATDKRGLLDGGISHWGPTAPRRFFGDAHWKQPEKWNRKAAADGERRRVFVASMADVFEDRPDLVPHRRRLWELIKACPHLDWLLLTKRPENIASMTPWLGVHRDGEWPPDALRGTDPWPNVWLGVTAEDSEHMIDRVHALRLVPAAVRFVSCEPILELIGSEIFDGAFGPRAGMGAVHWLIVGDESGHHARPADPAWVRVARDAAEKHDVAFHFKQWAGRDVDGIQVPWPSTASVRPTRTTGAKIHLPVLDGRQHSAFPR